MRGQYGQGRGEKGEGTCDAKGNLAVVVVVVTAMVRGRWVWFGGLRAQLSAHMAPRGREESAEEGLHPSLVLARSSPITAARRDASERQRGVTLCSVGKSCAAPSIMRAALRLAAVAAPRVRAVPAARVQLARRAASSVSAPDTSGRTPERTAELERLAEEHNGFLFGEVVSERCPGSPCAGPGRARSRLAARSRI